MDTTIVQLRLEPGERDQLLAAAAERLEHARAAGARARRRFAFAARARAELVDLGVSPRRRYEAMPLNVSATGLCVAVSTFIYPQRRCQVRLVALDGAERTVPATAEWCRHATKSAHLVGLRFDTTLVPGDFVADADDSDAQIPGAEGRREMAETAARLAQAVVRGDADEAVGEAVEALKRGWERLKAERAEAGREPQPRHDGTAAAA